MVDPTVEDVLAKLQSTGGRATPVLDEVLDIERRVLPGVIDYMNVQKNLDLPTIQGYYVGGEKVVGTWPVLIATTEVDTQVLSPANFQDNMNLMLFVAYDRFESRRQVYDAYDLAYLARAVLTSFNTGYSKDGKKLWSQLLPAGFTSVPQMWTEFQGFAVHFRIAQFPGNNLWV
jgi:hypothetical protein